MGERERGREKRRKRDRQRETKREDKRTDRQWTERRETEKKCATGGCRKFNKPIKR